MGLFCLGSNPGAPGPLKGVPAEGRRLTSSPSPPSSPAGGRIARARRSGCAAAASPNRNRDGSLPYTKPRPSAMRLPRRPLQQVPIEGGDVGGVHGPCSSEPSRRESRHALDVRQRLVQTAAARRAGRAVDVADQRDAGRPVGATPRSLNRLSGPSSGNSRSSASRSIATQPTVGEKFLRAMCRKIALPAPATVG